MDSSGSAARGRGRTSARKRNTLSAGPSSHLNSNGASDAVDQPPSSAPDDTILPASTSLETPSPSAPRGTRARARVAEGTIPSSNEPDSKGGHSLRKRARVDYTFDHVDEDVSDGGKTIASSTRALKRRRTDSALHENENDEDYGGNYMKRRSSEQLPPPSSAPRKRNQLQKSAINPHPVVLDDHAEDAEVQDTIEVGGHQSERSDESALRRTGSNTGSSSSNNDQKRSTTPQKGQSDLTPADLHNDNENDVGQPEANQSSLPDAGENPTNNTLHAQYEHLTPYIDGAYVEWPYTQPEGEPGAESQLTQKDAAEETPDDQLDGAQLDSAELDAVLEDAPIPDALAPAESTPVDDAMEEETPALSPLPIDTMANSPAADIDGPSIPPPPSRPILFKQTRDASEFVALFEDYKSLPPAELWERLAVTNRALVAWQEEYSNLRKITDDEKNAVRYRQFSAVHEHRVKMHSLRKSNGPPPEEGNFVVRGIKAARPNAEIQYARDQDRLMAAVYQFDCDEAVDKIGFQDPLAQKPDGKGRLRERPKQTAKAAEADDSVVIHGKRTRKPPVLFDGSEAVSSRSTPVPTQRRRRRAGYAAEDNSEVKPTDEAPVNTSAEPVPPKKKGKGGRPRKHPLPAPIVERAPTPAEEEVQEQPDQAEEEEPPRKRRRTKTATKAKAPIDEEEDEEAEEEKMPATKSIQKQASGNSGLRRGSRVSEIPSGTLHTSPMQPANAADESRPPTSSSIATQSTMASNNYQLREKRQRVFSLNPNEEGYDETPKPKRGRRPKKTQTEDFAAAAPLPAPPSSSPLAQKPVLEPALASKPPTKIKLKNYTAPIPAPSTSGANPNPFSVPSSSNSTPSLSSNGTGNGVANSADSTDPKEYKQMTKSEKMSQSMKARWASGSMSQAVAKRRATLANKKQVVKANEPGQSLETSPVATKS
ncbi:hypothetical protein F4861DRAFT_290961 [Xylaria intraflava]|nr:hypothetical protein F4861DRAFT_290961 [Xylaria intraflava]